VSIPAVAWALGEDQKTRHVDGEEREPLHASHAVALLHPPMLVLVLVIILIIILVVIFIAVFVIMSVSVFVFVSVPTPVTVLGLLSLLNETAELPE
jgi:uncharacterized membrane protein